MTNTEIKDYINAKYQEVDGYLDMVIHNTEVTNPMHDYVFNKFLGIRNALILLDTYIKLNGEYDSISESLKSEYENLFK